MQRDKIDEIIQNDDVCTLQQINNYVAMNSFKKCVIPMLQSINSYVLDTCVQEPYIEKNSYATNMLDTNSKKNAVYREAYLILKALTDQNLISEDMRKYELPNGYDENTKFTPIFTETGIHVELFASNMQSAKAA